MSSSKPAKAKGRRASRKPAPAKAGAAALRGKRTVAKAVVAKTAAKPVRAPKSAAAGPASDQMMAAAAAMERALAAGALDSLPNESLQTLMAAAVKVYSAKREAGETFLPVHKTGRVTPTDIMVTSSQLLRSGNLQVFELGMWQSWTGS